MHFRPFAAIAAISLVTASSAAVAAPSAIDAPPAARAGADLDQASALRGTTAWIIAAIALGLVIWGIIELLDDDDEAPVSP